LNVDKKFFHYLPPTIEYIGPISECNFLGLSNTALNLNKIDCTFLETLYNKQTIAFDWMIYSLLLLQGNKGKRVDACKTYYRIYDQNTAGDADTSLVGLKKEIQIKITHYSGLIDIDSKYIDLLKFYSMLYDSFEEYSHILLEKSTINNRYWWGRLNTDYFLKERKQMRIKNKEIKNYGKSYIIAEIGANHNGDMELAKKMIDSAVECGADAVKFQSWTNKSLIAQAEYDKNQKYDDSPKKHFGSLKEMVDMYYLREDQHHLLKEYCDQKGVDFCSSPFSEQEVDLLNDLDVPFFKVASMDINNLRLLKHIAKKRKPVVLSTGMATLSEIETAVKTIEEMGNYEIIILHCVSIYPPNAKDIHLNNIVMLQKLFPNYPIGFSDHTIGVSVQVAAVALGAAVIEKHFTTNKDLPGWDHEVSADPEEMIFIVKQSHVINEALGNFERTVSLAEQNKKTKFRRSIVLTRDMKEGEVLIEKDITFKRPGTHIRPDEEKYVIGRKLNRNMREDEILDWGDLA
jgi:sialic acid synthase SpsE